MATTSLFGDASLGVVVYGPDGKAYGSPAAAKAAGVNNYTMSPPPAAARPAAPAYKQQYIPGNYTPILTDENTGNPLPMKYGDPIYSVATDRVPSKLIGRVGMAPVVTPATNERGAPTITFADDPVYQKSQQMLDFEKKIASGEVQSSGLYGPALDGGKERRAFKERESAYQSYDPATDTFKFYDPEGNVTQQGPRAGSVLGGPLGGLMTGLNQTVANPDFQKAVMVAAVLGGGYAALGGLTPAVDLGINALPATGAGTAGASGTAGLLGSPFAPAASVAGSSAGYVGAGAAGLGSTLAGLGGSPVAPAASVAGATPGYVSAVGTGLGSTLAGLGGSPVAPVTSVAGATPGYTSAVGLGSTLPGLGGSPVAPATSAAGATPGYVSTTGLGTTGLGSTLPGLGGSPVAPATSAAGATPGYVSAGTGLLSSAGNAVSSILPSASTVSSVLPSASTVSSILPSASTVSSILPSVITAALPGIGAVNTAEKAREAAQIQADAQIKAAQIAADAAKFRPVGVTTRFGSSNFTTDAQGNVIGAGYTASPELKAYQDRLSALAAKGLTGAEGAAAAYAPLTTGAQSLFNLGQGYLKQTPEQQAADYIAKQQALLAPGQEQQLAQLQARLLAQGRGGLSVAQGGNLSATSPELAAYYNALAQSNLQLAAQGQQAGMEQAKFGAGLLSSGSDLMGKYYAGQTAAYSPFATAIDTSSGLENLAQQPLTLGTQIGAKTTASSAEAGRLLAQGMVNSAATLAPVNAFSYSGDLLSQIANNPELKDYLKKLFAT